MKKNKRGDIFIPKEGGIIKLNIDKSYLLEPQYRGNFDCYKKVIFLYEEIGKETVFKYKQITEEISEGTPEYEKDITNICVQCDSTKKNIKIKKDFFYKNFIQIET